MNLLCETFLRYFLVLVYFYKMTLTFSVEEFLQSDAECYRDGSLVCRMLRGGLRIQEGSLYANPNTIKYYQRILLPEALKNPDFQIPNSKLDGKTIAIKSKLRKSQYIIPYVLKKLYVTSHADESPSSIKKTPKSWEKQRWYDKVGDLRRDWSTPSPAFKPYLSFPQPLIS